MHHLPKSRSFIMCHIDVDCPSCGGHRIIVSGLDEFAVAAAGTVQKACEAEGHRADVRIVRIPIDVARSIATIDLDLDDLEIDDADLPY